MSDPKCQTTDAGLLGRPRSGSCGGGQAGPPRSSSSNRGFVEVVDQASRSSATGTDEKRGGMAKRSVSTPETALKRKELLAKTPVTIHKEKLKAEHKAMKKFLEGKAPIMRSPPQEALTPAKTNASLEKLISPFGDGTSAPHDQEGRNEEGEGNNTSIREDVDLTFTSIYISDEENKEEIQGSETEREGVIKKTEDNTNNTTENKENKKRAREDTPKKGSEDSKKEKYEDKAYKISKTIEKMCLNILNLEKILANTYKPKQELKEVTNKLVNLVECATSENLLLILKEMRMEAQGTTNENLEVENLKKEKEELQKEKEELQKEKDVLTEQFKDLEKKNKKLELKLEYSNAEKETNLPGNTEELTNRVEALELENKNLKAKVKHLESNLPVNTRDVSTEEIDQTVNLSELLSLVDRVWPEDVYLKTKILTESPVEDRSWDIAFDRKRGRKPKDDRVREIARKYPEIKQLIIDTEHSVEIEYLINETRSSLNKGTERYIYVLPKTEEIEDTHNMFSKLLQKAKGAGRTRMAVIANNREDAISLRKILEWLGRKHEMELAVIIQDHTVRTPNGDPRGRKGSVALTETVTVGQVGKSYSEILKDLKEKVDISKIGVSIQSVRSTVKGEVLLTVRKGTAETSSLGKAIKELGSDMKVRTNTNNILLHLTNIDGSFADEELAKVIMEETNSNRDMIGIIHMGMIKNGNKYAILEVPHDISRKLLDKGHIQTGWTRCKIRERINVPKCFRCLEHGHTSGQCRGQDRTGLCINCCKEGHKASTCTNSKFCGVCGREGHRIGSTACPRYGEHLRMYRRTSSVISGGNPKRSGPGDSERAGVISPKAGDYAERPSTSVAGSTFSVISTSLVT
ncbi:hypothetical protein ABEB36_014389 [Hypothenemus hampei]|uniref:CCHC-type domain-containing protein n=1 Tax=Hypothenemus hampei TaxID=57062 RepID=A0ABD1E587_HYPHA